jgi:hypothetical protein
MIVGRACSFDLLIGRPGLPGFSRRLARRPRRAPAEGSSGSGEQGEVQQRCFPAGVGSRIGEREGERGAALTAVNRTELLRVTVTWNLRWVIHAGRGDRLQT